MRQELIRNVKFQDPGAMKNFLDVKLTEQTGSSVLWQSYYIEKNLRRHGLKVSRPVSTVRDPSSYVEITKNVKPTAEESEKNERSSIS